VALGQLGGKLNDLIARDILAELKERNRLQRETNRLLRCLLESLNGEHHDRVLGGVMTQIGEPDMATGTLLSIAPGNTPKFAVSPAFSGAAFTTNAAQASVVSSDTVNFPAVLDPTDPTGLTVDVAIPVGATLEDGVTISWGYTNTDGTQATPVVGTYNIVTGTFDDVTGGTITQIA
jgi:hypothetical protein